MVIAPRHTLSKLFQLCTGYEVFENHFKKRFITERNHHCECGQLETVERIIEVSDVPPVLDEGVPAQIIFYFILI
jgi:hypothetical protein